MSGGENVTASRPTRGWTIAAYALLLVVPLALALGWLNGLKWLDEAVIVIIGAATIVVSVDWLAKSPSDSQIAESRQRVRSAERDLEAALRISVPPEAHAQVPAGGDEHVALPQLSATGRLTLPELWSVTHSRLDLYHDIATGQAKRSFRNAQFAMVVGFVLLVAFVAVALNASTTAGSVVAGSLGAVSAALAGYVSRTFVKSQEAAASHLRAYFDQPLEFSRYLAAERIVRDSELNAEQRAEILTALVQAMVAVPQPTPPALPAVGVPSQQPGP